MRAPGLVAKLMGLDSLPATHRDKHKKGSNSVDCDVTEEKFVDKCHCGSDRDGLNMVKGSTKVESRPQKLQKTGQFERRAVTRFGAEALQIKGVLSRSRKHHHPKLAPPVKSPRTSSSKTATRTSRLIDVATRILEPGLQATNRAKSALTYSSSMNYCPRDEVLTEDIGIMLPNIVKQQDIEDCNEGVGKSLTGKTSYKNSSNLFDAVDSRPNFKEQQFVCPSTSSNYMSSHKSEITKPRLPTSTPDQERNVIYQRHWDQQSIAVKQQDNTRITSQTITVIKPLSQEGQSQRQFRSHQRRPQQQESSSFTFKQSIQTQNETFVSRNRTPPRAKINNLQSRRASSATNAISGVTDFVALNRSIISRGQPRASTLAGNSVIDKDRKVCSKRDDSLSPLKSPVRKRRTVSVNARVESTGFANPMSTRQGNTKSYSVTRKEVASSSRSMDCACIKNRLLNGECNKNNYCREGDVSCTFNSPLRLTNFVSMGLKERSHQIDKNASYQRRLVLDENDGKTSLQNELPLKGDALSTILEQKLKELASQEEDEMISGGSHPEEIYCYDSSGVNICFNCKSAYVSTCSCF
ncbi:PHOSPHATIDYLINOSITOL N-ACETYLGLUCOSAMINYLTRANSFERASE SUBUNIT P DOWN SYNDROME CRITICAL REGION PROTEIN 5 -RELATED [Salix viminalis]|uniref:PHOSPHATIDYLINOSITOL N-ACETYLGLUCOSAMINYLTRANSFERASE SUBUNIT P DOWN SYNDROME CRITICAL REGION PROTEIN 5 -RELATED n=1 Tax=Salix viminalis TaxID=40686 RepID=A0A9Q0P9V7_SALVM|nr:PHOSPHATIDYLINOSITOL N-ACETYLGLUCOSAMINYLTRANSFERASE SUBUNIT P DOWN SYNDROME CRITICAL REGION PROTEIN 5 -RELATED [Salix viminalis]